MLKRRFCSLSLELAIRDSHWLTTYETRDFIGYWKLIKFAPILDWWKNRSRPWESSGTTINLAVVYKVGLCIALWDVEKIEESFIFPGDGATHTIVHFRYVVFRPFVDEILIGRIKSCSKDGVHVTMGFFDDITIPSDSLQHPSKFNEREQLWSWEYEAEEEVIDLPMEINGDIRFRVVDEMFVDTTPTSPEEANPMPPPSASSGASTLHIMEQGAKKSPYTLTGSISEMGLGMLAWWS